MIPYVKYQNKNEESKAYGKWYARVQHQNREVDLEELATTMQENCTVKRADILAVLSELTPTMKNLLQQGRKVRIPYLGLFKIMIQTKGADTPEKWTLAKGLKRAYVNFRAESTVNGPQTHRTTQSMVRGAVLQEAIDYDRPETEEETEIQNP